MPGVSVRGGGSNGGKSDDRWIVTVTRAGSGAVGDWRQATEVAEIVKVPRLEKTCDTISVQSVLQILVVCVGLPSPKSSRTRHAAGVAENVSWMRTSIGSPTSAVLGDTDMPMALAVVQISGIDNNTAAIRLYFLMVDPLPLVGKWNTGFQAQHNRIRFDTFT